MKNIVYFLLLSILVGCSVKKASQSEKSEPVYITYETDCNKMFKKIKEKWETEEKLLCCLYDKDLIESLRVNTECFVGFTRESLKKYFGKPYRDLEKSITYYVYSDCERYDLSKLRYKVKFYFSCENTPTTTVTHCSVMKADINPDY